MEKSESINSKLRLELVKQAIKCELPFNDFKLLAEWLGCYQYMLPTDRCLNKELAQEVCYYNIRNTPHASVIFRSWLLCDLVESTLTEQEQKEILPWMKELNS